MSIIFGKPPKMTKVVDSRNLNLPPFKIPTLFAEGFLEEAVNRVLALPCVASKSYLITIGDRTVGGITARDQKVDRWQVPVADVAVSATSLTSRIKTSEAIAIGERPPIALISAASSVRMAGGEALLNLAAADLEGGLSRVCFSANWMAATSHLGQGAALYEAVAAITDLCLESGVSILVGKDSLSMKMTWKEEAEQHEVTSPLSLVVSAFGPVQNIHQTWTPALQRPQDTKDTVLFLVEFASNQKALGGSALAQVFNQIGNIAPDVHDARLLKLFFEILSELRVIVLAYHDRSDGGLLTTLEEMMFAGRCGLEVSLDNICDTVSSDDQMSIIEALFNEELGAVFQAQERDQETFAAFFQPMGSLPS